MAHADGRRQPQQTARSATAVRPSAKATRPAASCASGWSGEERSDNSRTHRWASRSKAAVAGPASTPALTRASSACARHQRRPCRSKSRRASVAQRSAVGGSPAASAHLAAVSSSSARLVGRPWIWSNWPIAASASCIASLNSPAAVSAAQRWMLRSGSMAPRRWNRSAALSKQLSASGRSPSRRATKPRFIGDLARFQFLAVRVEQVLGSAQVGDGASR